MIHREDIMSRANTQNLLQGNILRSLISFAFPVLLALFLQAMYGAADLIIVGQFADTFEQSGVASGSQLFNMITMVITGLTMGVTVFVGDRIGAGKPEEAGRGVGTGIAIFAVLAVAVTALVVPFSDSLAAFMHAPAEAFSQTGAYVKICGLGTVFITAYNVIGAVFRGIGDSRTPLLTVAIACAINILGDLVLVAGFGMGAAGAAIATVSAQAISVVFSLYFISRKNLPFAFSKKFIRFDPACLKKILLVGVPIALQELLVQFSFLFIQMVVNSMGVMESAAVGVAEKVCVFLMLVASAYMQSISAFVAQNNGAVLRHQDRVGRRFYHGLHRIFCGGFAGLCLFRRGTGHRLCPRLFESLRHRLPAHRHPLLLHRLLQRLRKNCFRHGARRVRRVLCEDPGGLLDEPAGRRFPVPHRFGHAHLLRGANSSLCGGLPHLSKKRKTLTHSSVH